MTNPTRQSPDMTGKAADIDDPIHLYSRIGYRIFLKWREGNYGPDATATSVYDGYIKAELKRLDELNS